jgi:adenylate cyclase
LPNADPRSLQPRELDQIADKVQAALARLQPLAVYGSVAAGADLIVAELALARGVELHVVLPCGVDDFLRVSVQPFGGALVGRVQSCLERASSIRIVAERSENPDDVPFGYASEISMGLSILRARSLDAEPVQLAIWDGQTIGRGFGTEVDVSIWSDLGLRQEIVDAPRRGESTGARSATTGGDSMRIFRSMLFADVRGFSALHEASVPDFIRVVLGELGATLSQYEQAIEFKNTWGDGLFVILSDIVATAHCALALQRSISVLPLQELRLPAHLSLRVSCHHGPVYRADDPILGATNYYGVHVTKTARIEPITPVGSVYVTEPFAALLALRNDHNFHLDYVGAVSPAKNYGVQNLYLLHHRLADEPT